ncbi:MAG: acyl carrier protein [Bryobacteraceae bacterium]
MTQDEALQTVQRAVRLTFNDPDVEVTRSTTADDMDGWDSLSHAVFMFRLEKYCGVRVPRSLASSFRDIGELVDYLVEVMGEK